MKRKQPVVHPQLEPVPHGVLAEGAGLLYGAADAVTRVKQGLPLREFDALRDLLDLTVDDLATRIGISPATLSRRRRELEGGRLDPEHSDRLMRYARLYWQAVQLVGGHEDTARAWLKRPARALDGVSPLDFADTEVGGREVETLIQRLEQGVYT